jgi:hypothetical protein
MRHLIGIPRLGGGVAATLPPTYMRPMSAHPMARLAGRAAIAGAALNAPWEVAHTSLYAVGRTGLFDHVVCCGFASLGDAAGVAIIAVTGAAAFRDARWHRHATAVRVVLTMVLGGGVAVVVEYTARAAGIWSYSPAMPRLLGTAVGLSPFAQFVLTPALAIFVGVPLLERLRRPSP